MIIYGNTFYKTAFFKSEFVATKQYLPENFCGWLKTIDLRVFIVVKCVANTLQYFDLSKREIISQKISFVYKVHSLPVLG